MSNPWSEESQKELRVVVVALWSLMGLAYLDTPSNLAFNLFNFPLLLHPVFLVMVILWGVFLFWQVLSLLPVSKRTKQAMSYHSLAWLTLLPSISWLFWIIVALDVTYPLIDPIVIPGYLAGVMTASYLYLNYVTTGRTSQRMRKIAMWLWCLAMSKAKSGRGIIFQLGHGASRGWEKIR